MKEIIFAGLGGHGVLTSGLIISNIATKNKYNVTWVPSYGSSMRGGDAHCTVKFSENDYIYNPSPEDADILLAMSESALLKFLPYTDSDSIIIVSDSVKLPEDLINSNKIIKINCNKIAKSLGNPKVANLIMTGAIIKLLGNFSLDESIDVVNDLFEEKNKAEYKEINEKALKEGYNCVSEI